MGFASRIFGLVLVLAGIFIAVYWTAWELMILVSEYHLIHIYSHVSKVNSKG